MSSITAASTDAPAQSRAHAEVAQDGQQEMSGEEEMLLAQPPCPTAKDARLEEISSRIQQLKSVRDAARNKLEQTMSSQAQSRDERQQIHKSVQEQRRLCDELANVRDRLQAQLKTCIDDLKGLKTFGSRNKNTDSTNNETPPAANSSCTTVAGGAAGDGEQGSRVEEGGESAVEVSNPAMSTSSDDDSSEENAIDRLRLEKEKSRLTSQLAELRGRIDMLLDTARATRDQLKGLDSSSNNGKEEAMLIKLRKERDEANIAIEKELKMYVRPLDYLLIYLFSALFACPTR
jgi:hypothetical protein